MNAILLFFLDLIIEWGKLFAAPIFDLNTLWIIIPIYINWVFTEFYQEKKGTSLGNAISNGAVLFWVGIDWTRTIINGHNQGMLPIGVLFFTKILISLMVFGYGLWIIIDGILVKKTTKLIGRIREITYVCLMFTPIIYGEVMITFKTIFAIILFFPIFYFIVEFIDWIIPDPKTYEEEASESKKEDSFIPAAVEPSQPASDPFSQNPSFDNFSQNNYPQNNYPNNNFR